ncbi:MAG: hypothetical protein WA058_04130 [Minisyncoccia bacterium]
MFTCELSLKEIDVAISALDPVDAKIANLTSWSLKPLQKKEDIVVHFRLAKVLSDTFYALRVRDAFAPNVAPANARIVGSSQLTDAIELGAAMLHRNQELPADGMFLRAGQSFVMSAAGCPLIIAGARGVMVIAHAARDSLVDRGALQGKPTRKHLSVVNAIIEELGRYNILAPEISMIMLFAIPATAFEHNETHPVHGAYNRLLIQHIDAQYPYGIIRKDGKTFLDLEQVFIGQARQAGVRGMWATHSLGAFSHLAHTCDGKGTDRRNLYVVRRNS